MSPPLQLVSSSASASSSAASSSAAFSPPNVPQNRPKPIQRQHQPQYPHQQYLEAVESECLEHYESNLEKYKGVQKLTILI